MKLSHASLARAQGLIAQRLGLDCGEPRRADMESALLEGARKARAASVDAFLSRLEGLPDDATDWTTLAQRLTVGETYFFRDPPLFEALERRVIPVLLAARGTSPRLSVWSAGCSTGEEAYSLAILLDEIAPSSAEWSPGVLGTDVNVAALDTARRGLYRPWSLRDTPAAIRERYFVHHGHGYEVVPEIRQRVRFAALNLAVDAVPVSVTPVDLLLCRNVLMYLSRPVAERVVQRLRAALAPDGWLVVAAAEASSEWFRPLVPVNFPGTILFTSETSARRHGVVPPAEALGGFGPPPREPAATTAPGRPRPSPRLTPRREPPIAAETLSRARQLADRGELDEALRACQEVVKRDRLDPAAHLLVAAIHQEKGDVAAALAALRRALYLDPDSAEGHAALGHLLLQRGDGRRGRRHLETAARLAAGREEVS